MIAQNSYFCLPFLARIQIRLHVHIVADRLRSILPHHIDQISIHAHQTNEFLMQFSFPLLPQVMGYNVRIGADSHLGSQFGTKPFGHTWVVAAAEYLPIAIQLGIGLWQKLVVRPKRNGMQCNLIWNWKPRKTTRTSWNWETVSCDTACSAIVMKPTATTADGPVKPEMYCRLLSWSATSSFKWSSYEVIMYASISEPCSEARIRISSRTAWMRCRWSLCGRNLILCSLREKYGNSLVISLCYLGRRKLDCSLEVLRDFYTSDDRFPRSERWFRMEIRSLRKNKVKKLKFHQFFVFNQ